jgi:hypothetical protein
MLIPSTRQPVQPLADSGRSNKVTQGSVSTEKETDLVNQLPDFGNPLFQWLKSAWGFL